ncbi:hypothetical protein RYX36_019974, partial [Vicia faba]
MATAKTNFLLGMVFIFCSMLGESRSFEDPRRSLLVDGGPAIFNVKTFGALADDQTDNVLAFRAAWMEACKNITTPATLLFPEGIFRTSQTMFAGPCTSPSPITVQVIGTLKATTDLSEYVSPDWITFFDVDNLVLKGSGVFDGQGAISWPLNDCKQNKGKCASLPD